MKNPLASTRYQRKRERFLWLHPECAGPDSVCEREGRTALAVEVDHIVARHKDRTRDVFDETNWQGLCGACHKAKTLRDKGYKPQVRIGLDGYPLQLMQAGAGLAAVGGHLEIRK